MTRLSLNLSRHRRRNHRWRRSRRRRGRRLGLRCRLLPDLRHHCCSSHYPQDYPHLANQNRCRRRRYLRLSRPDHPSHLDRLRRLALDSRLAQGCHWHPRRPRRCRYSRQHHQSRPHCPTGYPCCRSPSHPLDSRQRIPGTGHRLNRPGRYQPTHHSRRYRSPRPRCSGRPGPFPALPGGFPRGFPRRRRSNLPILGQLCPGSAGHRG